MAIKTRNGFQLSGHVNGQVSPASHRYQKSTTQGANSVIYVGDPVALTSAGTVSRYHANTSAGWPETWNWLGVCTGIFETEDGRPLTHRTNKFAATSDSFWIDVIDDPDAVWEVSYGATANQTVIGSLAYVQYATPVTAAGISGAGLSSAQPAATAVAAGLRIIGVVNLSRDGANASNADQDGRVRVIAADHTFRNSDTN
jgi:hypothetical protein